MKTTEWHTIKLLENKTYNDLSMDGKIVWEMLCDIPINSNDEIDSAFLHFTEGTHREEIWLWFENYYNILISNIL